MNEPQMVNHKPTGIEVADAHPLGTAAGYALLRLKANIHRRTEYYRTATSDPHQINQALYVALLELENAITETVSDVKGEPR